MISSKTFQERLEYMYMCIYKSRKYHLALGIYHTSGALTFLKLLRCQLIHFLYQSYLLSLYSYDSLRIHFSVLIHCVYLRIFDYQIITLHSSFLLTLNIH